MAIIAKTMTTMTTMTTVTTGEGGAKRRQNQLPILREQNSRLTTVWTKGTS